MKKYSAIQIQTLALSVMVLLMACEKVVTINVKSAGNRVVVQGNVNNQPGSYTVQLNYSENYYGTNTFPAISGASVLISDDEGHSEGLIETKPGIYTTHSLVGKPKQNYHLEINTNGSLYTANEQMPNPVPIDSFLILPTLSRNSQVVDGFRIVCKFTDPVGVGNFYKVVISSRDTAALGNRTSRIVSDKLTDGKELSVTFRTQLILGDTVNIQFQSITRSTYDFFNTLGNAKGSVGASQFLSSLPANPTNNISNQGLGYFSAYSVITQSAVIK